jgi:hypothetical protein
MYIEHLTVTRNPTHHSLSTLSVCKIGCTETVLQNSMFLILCCSIYRALDSHKKPYPSLSLHSLLAFERDVAEALEVT